MTTDKTNALRARGMLIAMRGDSRRFSERERGALTAAIDALATAQPEAKPETCAHSWRDYGTVNNVWCAKCQAMAVAGHEHRPYEPGIATRQAQGGSNG